jgi:hypothetical protein
MSTALPAPRPVAGLVPTVRSARPDEPQRSGLESDEYFAHQPSPRSALPGPAPLLENLTRCVIEILAGARDLEQISRWVTDDVYRHLLKRVVLSARARQAKGRIPVRPAFAIGSISLFEPRDGVVEAVVIVRGRARVRAVAIRLEGLDSRWRATAINVL